MDELISRYVFVDTSIYENKNFQFHIHALGRFKDLCLNRKLYLLSTEITNNEIISHLKEKATDVAKHIKDFKSTARILRNLPEIPQYAIFEQLPKDTIETALLKKFEEYIDEAVYENVNIDTVLMTSVIKAYFTKCPPFSMKKKDEFPDAIVLMCLENWAKKNNDVVYIMSVDSDMSDYCKNSKWLQHVSDLEGFIDIVIKSEEELKEPSEFALTIFKENWNEIENNIQQLIEFIEFTSESYSLDDEIDEVSAKNITILAPTLLSVSRDSAEFDIKVKFDADAWHTITDYDRSIWDSEDKDYIFLAQTRIRVLHEVNCSVSLKISYEDGLRANLEIDDPELDSYNIALDLDTGIEIERDEQNIFD